MSGTTGDLNITDEIVRWSASGPSRPALVVDGRKVDYAALEASMLRGAAWLAGRGVAAGSGAAVCMVDPLKSAVVALALARIGASQFALVPAALSNAAVATMHKAGCTAVVTDIASLTIGGLRKIGIEEDWPADDGPASSAAPRSGDGDLPCFVAMSSGTTAAPKLMVVTHRQFHHRMTYAGPMGFDDQDRLLSLLDLGVFVQRSVVLRALMSGATVHLAPLEAIAAIVDYCNRNEITSIFALPYMVSTWLRMASPSEDTRLIHVRKLAMAGSTVTPEEFEAAAARLTPNIFVTYGSNELGVATYADPDMRRRFPLSIGRLVEGAEAEIVDADDRTAAVGEVGRIRVRTMGMITAYPGQPGLNDYHFRGGWFYPGDLASRTAEDVLLFHGRADDMMIFNGNNIYPSEIEAALRAHPAVREVAAFPWRSPVHQDIPVAAVVAKAAVDEKELVAFCRLSLGVRSPRRIFLVAGFPRNALGKVAKRRLAEEIAKVFGANAGEAEPG